MTRDDEQAASAAETGGELLVERQDGVTHLTLCRPSRMNALSAALVDRLQAEIELAERDGTRVVTLRGRGASFCSGFDLGDLATQTEGDLALRFLRIERLLQAVRHASVETVALAHGSVFGAGADLFCACARRVATSDTVFRFPGVQFGVVLGTRRLAQIVGESAAWAILMDGRKITASEGLSMGLVTKEAPPLEWDGIVTAALAGADMIPAVTRRAVADRLRDDSRAEDLAALATSVALPGLKQRITDYRGRVRGQKVGTAARPSNAQD